MRPIPLLLLLSAVLALVGVVRAESAPPPLIDTVHTLKLARGTTLSVLVSKRPGTTPTVAVLLFPGYPGVLRIREEGGRPVYDQAGNFLVRARGDLASDQVFTVLVDCPADQWAACEDAYRTSPAHAADVSQVVDLARNELGARQVYLLGTSYGTVSTGWLARALEGRIDGAIHTAAFTEPRSGRHAHGTSMRGFDWTKTAVPQLFVHHRDDPCDITRHGAIAARHGNAPLITVQGSEGSRGDACQAFTAHGFIGRERATMAAISDWILHRNVQAVVGSE